LHRLLDRFNGQNEGNIPFDETKRRFVESFIEEFMRVKDNSNTSQLIDCVFTIDDGAGGAYR
jgi:hypothetical protein